MRNATLILVFLLDFLVSVLGQKPWDPTPVNQEWWMNRHNWVLQYNRENADKIQVVFSGASLVEYFDRPEGRQVWDQYYAPYGAANQGFGGDGTQHLLWRIQNGELDGINPKLVILNIGSNNVGGNPNNDEIVRGVNTVVDFVHDKLPNANILLVGNFPRGDVKPVRQTLERMRDIDTKLISLVHEDRSRKSEVIDLFFPFSEGLDGVNKELFLNDEIHFNESGYYTWYSLMNSTFHRLMQ